MAFNQRYNSGRHNRAEQIIQGSSECAELLVRKSVPITPEMIRDAVEELAMHRLYVTSAMIGGHLHRRYPVERNIAALTGELMEKLRCAVCVGLIEQCKQDAYCTPTLRKEANFEKSALTAFWEMYNNTRGASTRI